MHKLADLPPEVQAVIVDTIERWRQRRVCPEPAIHATLWAARETTWRETAERRAKDTDGVCGWCAGRLP